MQHDVKIYEYNYADLSKLSFANAFAFNGFKAPLYYFSCAVFGHLGLSFYFYCGVISLFSSAVLCSYIYRNSKNPFISIMAFVGINCFIFSFYLLRQTIAASFILIAANSLYKNKTVKSIILVIIASLFHLTAIIFLPVIIFKFVKFNTIILSAALLLTFVLVFFRMQIGSLVTLVLRSDYVGEYESKGHLGASFFLILIIFLLYMATNIDSLFKNDRKTKTIFLGLMLATVIQSFASYSYTFTRLNFFFIEYAVLLAVPDIVDSESYRFKHIRKKDFLNFMKVVKLSFLAIFITLFYLGLQGEGLDNYIVL